MKLILLFLLILSLGVVSAVNDSFIPAQTNGTMIWVHNGETGETYVYDFNRTFLESYNVTQNKSIMISSKYCESWFFGLIKRCRYDGGDFKWSFGR